jgi:RNA polymerase sigma-70 factor, ECF subfamily
MATIGVYWRGRAGRSLRRAVNLGDPQQFELAYRSHHRRVRAAAQRVVIDAAAAEDVTQEVFLKLWLRPELFDGRRGSLAAFLCVMARSRALDRLRADGALDRARNRLAEYRVALEPANVEEPVAALMRHDESEELRGALMKLPPAQREAITLAYGRELNSIEIARRTRVGRATARSRLRLGLTKLRADLGGAERQAA